uniref:Cytochrome P450 n=1 Tax=Leersia perrieri TaxID=77586 RepID=A0A0D9VFR9_9ORYZ
MELFYCCCCSLLFALLVHVILRALARRRQPRPRLPPGPWQLPIIGSLHHLLRGGGGLPHRAMADLSLHYGPLMLLRVCERVVVVVSSAEAAGEIYGGGRDAAFSERPGSPGIDELYRSGQGIIFAPYGDHWRQLRRILMTELLSQRRVESFRRIREEEASCLVSSLMVHVQHDSSGGGVVNIDQLLGRFMADSAVRAIFGDALPDRDAFLRMIKRGTELSSLFDVRDLFPSSRLARLLASWSGGKAELHRLDMFRLMDDILKQHDEKKAAGGGERDDGKQDMVDVLLRIQSEGDMRVSLTHGVIRTFLTVRFSFFFFQVFYGQQNKKYLEVPDVLGAALETSTTTLQWVMADLMANPNVMQKAQAEVRRVFTGQATINEAALGNLQYLKAVIKETLRLHPPSPAFPRVCLEEGCKIQGYDIPRGTIVLTNVWAISRDPKYWVEPQKYMPERFEDDSAVDFRGMHFEFTPFGVGRRICPGMNFSHVNVEIALASLLFHFDWELPSGVKPDNVDMTELFGVTMRRKTELFIRPIPHVPL